MDTRFTLTHLKRAGWQAIAQSDAPAVPAAGRMHMSAVVTIDAMGCQREIASRIIEKKAD
jgi:hypothetical protein